MSFTGVTAFDQTLQLTNAWLKDLMTRLETDDRQRAYLALKATLHALRDRLPPENAIHLAAQLPMLVRGFYYDGWRPSETPRAVRHKDDFLHQIAVAARRDADADAAAEDMARSVFAVLAEHLDPGEARKVAQLLPHEIRALWPSAVAGADSPSVEA